MANSSYLRRTLRAVPLAAVLLLSGCSTYVTVSSNPEGALITDAAGTTTYGYAPVQIEYKTSALEATQKPGRCATVPGFRARWQSCAEAFSAAPLDVCDLKYGASVMLERPSSVPGLETDLQWALSRAQIRAREAEAERDRMQLYLDNRWFWGSGFGMGIGWGFPIR